MEAVAYGFREDSCGCLDLFPQWERMSRQALIGPRGGETLGSDFSSGKTGSYFNLSYGETDQSRSSQSPVTHLAEVSEEIRQHVLE